MLPPLLSVSSSSEYKNHWWVHMKLIFHGLCICYTMFAFSCAFILKKGVLSWESNVMFTGSKTTWISEENVPAFWKTSRCLVCNFVLSLGKQFSFPYSFTTVLFFGSSRMHLVFCGLFPSTFYLHVYSLI